jgi:hypothetical protein
MMALFLLGACTGIQTLPDGKLDDSVVTVDSGESGGAVDGVLSAEPASLDFGAVGIGSTRGMNVLVKNNGDTPFPLEILVRGDSAFSTSTTSTDLDGELVVNVDFAPDAAGSYSGTLKLKGGEYGNVDVPLSGSAEASTDGPNISVNPTTIDFGTVDIGSSAGQTILVENTGTADLMVSEVRFSNNVFSNGGGSLVTPQLIEPGKNKVLTVNFSPTSTTRATGDVTFVSDDPDQGSLKVTVSGTGLDACDICQPLLSVDTGGSDPYGLDFALVTVFGMSATSTVTMYNDGDQPLQLSSASVTNDFIASCGTFSVTGFRASTIQPGGQSSFDVTWRVTGSCLDVEQSSIGMNILEISSNDPMSPYTIKLSGAAI